MDELDEDNLTAAAGNKTNNERLSLAVPHLDLSTTLNIFISGVLSLILMLKKANLVFSLRRLRR